MKSFHVNARTARTNERKVVATGNAALSLGAGHLHANNTVISVTG